MFRFNKVNKINVGYFLLDGNLLKNKEFIRM